MRISTNTIFAQNVTQLDSLSSNVALTQQQVASGHRILNPADDPAGAALALQVTQTSSLNTEYISNIGTTNDAATLAEGTLQGVTSLLNDVQTTAVQAGNPTLSNSDRASLASSMQTDLTQLIALANSTDAVGNYLFSGFKGSTQPFVNGVDPATGKPAVQYQGDDGQHMIQVSPNQQIATSSSGADIFMRIKNGNGTFATQAATSNAGSGIISLGNVINPTLVNGDSYQLLFTGAASYNVYDTSVLAPQAAATNTGSGIASSVTVTNPATVNTDTYQIAFSGPPSTYAINDQTTGTQVSTGTAYVSGQPITFNGIQFSMQGTPANGDTFTINPNNNAVLNSSGTFVSGQSISFGGMQFNIQGTPATGDNFTVIPSANESMFQTISNFINTLNTPVIAGNPASTAQLTAGVNAAINGMSNALNSVLMARASLGSRMNELSSLTSTQTALGTQYTQTLSTLQDLDYNKALTQLSAQQTILTAAQKSFTQVQSLSLFNYIR